MFSSVFCLRSAVVVAHFSMEWLDLIRYRRDGQ